ncbi:secondary thiamine-phosphate synthase enzyme YjbQ [Rhizobium glycinendophyticum]|uniref:YjbQ family protein n=1 Tax=Rhizobium glycinendophyticum TaxID=2589807 RepID=A0A504ULE3_9HYPH|nr:secondary thiamine-phosphate synthase enzyme YjbQ [Rhizobium glycinendophyticum]TPP11535.1 YjbQ family protein [Rhizobium glycinendophyticum]
MAQRRITIDTCGPGLYEFTEQAEDLVRQAPGEDGVLTVFVRHTSCSLLIQENADPSVKVDLQAFFRRLVPPATDPSMSYIIHRDEGPDDMPAHIRAALLPVSLGIPYAGGRLLLGTWQGIYLVEHRDRPHRREVILSL